MPQNRLGSLVPYETPPPSQGDTPTSNTQPKATDKGPQAQKRKRGASKSDKDATMPPPGNKQSLKKAKPNQEEIEVQNAISSPTSQQSEGQSQPPPHSPSREKTPQPFSLPDIASHKSPSLPPSPTEEARLRKKAQANHSSTGKPIPPPTHPAHRRGQPPPAIPRAALTLTSRTVPKLHHGQTLRQTKRRTTPQPKKETVTQPQPWRWTSRKMN